MSKQKNKKKLISESLSVSIFLSLLGLLCILISVFFEYAEVICNASLFVTTIGIVIFALVEYFKFGSISRGSEVLIVILVPTLVGAMINGGAGNWPVFMSTVISTLVMLITIMGLKKKSGVLTIAIGVLSIIATLSGIIEYIGFYRRVCSFIIGIYDIIFLFILNLIFKK